MEEEKLDLQVGDRITYKYLNDNKIYTSIIEDIGDLKTYKRMIESKIEISSIKILKIERPHYEVVEEKKELLTEEEREFLKDICKYYKNAKKIEFYGTYFSISNNRNYVLLNPDYPDNMKFKKCQKNKEYTIKELGLEED